MAPHGEKNMSEQRSPPTSSKTEKVIGFWGTQLKTKEEETEIITLAPPANKSQDIKAEESSTDATSSHAKGPANSWDDQLLRQRKVKNGKSKTIAWRPGSGRHIDEGRNSYKPFTHIVRTLHLEDAVEVLVKNRIEPKNLVTFSSLESSILPKDHPCKNLKVLWFSARFFDETEDEPNWYGNVEFAVNCDLLLEMFKYSFLVEMLTTPTHTVSRILLTNKDYTAVLPRYHRQRAGGGWQVTPEGHLALQNCSRYKFKGENMFDHVLEFMLEVTSEDEKKILSNCEISFKNHEDAKDTQIPHVCNRYQRLRMPCPSPYSPQETATMLYQMLQMMHVDWNKVLSKLTEHAKTCLPKQDEKEQTGETPHTLVTLDS